MPDSVYEIEVDGGKYRVESDRDLSQSELRNYASKIRKQNAASSGAAHHDATTGTKRHTTTPNKDTVNNRQQQSAKSSTTTKKLPAGWERMTLSEDYLRQLSPIQRQAYEIRHANRQANQDAGFAQQHSLLAPYHAVAEPLSHLLSMGVRGLQEQTGNAVSGLLNQVPGQKGKVKPSLSPLQAEINRQQRGLSLLERSAEEDPRGIGHAVSPDTTRRVEAMPDTGHKGVEKGLAKSAMGLASLDNIVLMAAMAHPAVAAGGGSQILARAASGYFGAQLALSTKEKLTEWNKTGRKFLCSCGGR